MVFREAGHAAVGIMLSARRSTDIVAFFAALAV